MKKVIATGLSIVSIFTLASCQNAQDTEKNGVVVVASDSSEQGVEQVTIDPNSEMGIAERIMKDLYGNGSEYRIFEGDPYMASKIIFNSDSIDVKLKAYEIAYNAYEIKAMLYHTNVGQWVYHEGTESSIYYEVIEENGVYKIGRILENLTIGNARSITFEEIVDEIQKFRRYGYVESVSNITNILNVIGEKEYTYEQIEKMVTDYSEVNGEGCNDEVVFDVITKNDGVYVEFAELKAIMGVDDYKSLASHICSSKIFPYYKEEMLSKDELYDYWEETGIDRVRDVLKEEKRNINGVESYCFSEYSFILEKTTGYYYYNDKAGWLADKTGTGLVCKKVERYRPKIYTADKIYLNEYVEKMKSCTVAQWKANPENYITGFSLIFMAGTNNYDTSIYGEEKILADTNNIIAQMLDGENVFNALAVHYGINVEFAE